MHAFHFHTVVHPLTSFLFIFRGGRSAHLSRPTPPPSGAPTAEWSLKSASLSPRLHCLSLSSLGWGLAMFSVNPACHCCPLWAQTLFFVFFFSSHDWHSSLRGSSTQQVFRVEFSFFSLTKVYLIRLMVSNDTSLCEIEPAGAQPYPWRTRAWDFSQNPYTEAQRLCHILTSFGWSWKPPNSTPTPVGDPLNIPTNTGTKDIQTKVSPAEQCELF